MQIMLNGESYTTTAQSIAELITEVGVKEKMIALAQNTVVIQAKDWDNTLLCENDEIEILQFMGGG